MQRATGTLGCVLQLLGAARTNAARWEVDHPHEAGVIARVLQQAQISQCVLDFSAFEKAQTPIHPVRHARIEQGGFNHPALGIAAVQHSDFVARGNALAAIAVLTIAQQLPHFIDHPLRLGKVAGGLVHPHRLARALVGAQVFAQAPLVVADQGIGAVQNVAVAAVILFQLDLVAHAKFAHKVGHVAHPCAAKCVNALVVVAHSKHSAGGRTQLFDPGVLQAVGVLKFVNQHMAKAALVVLAQGVVVAQQLKAAQHQLTEIDHAFALALVFIELVYLHFLACIGVARLHVGRAQTVFFAGRDEPLGLLGWKALVIHRKLLVQPLDGRELVLGVQDLKRLGQVGQLPMGAQKSIAQAMEGANPHAPHIHRQHGRQTGQHLFGRLVGEGHRQHPGRCALPALQQPSNAGGQHPGFARARARQDERVLARQGHRSALLGVEALQQGRVGGRCGRRP